MIQSSRMILLLTVSTRCVLSSDVNLSNGKLTPEQCKKFMDEMNEPDSRMSRLEAREIAAGTELRTKTLMEQFSDKDRSTHTQSIQNYTMTSTQINGDARKGSISTQITRLSTALEKMSELFEQDTYKRLYRSQPYATNKDIPYGDTISVGDYVTDKGFVSTSEAKQFVQGVQQKKNDDVILKLAMIGKSGVPIACSSSMYDYCNANEEKMAEVQRVANLGELETRKKKFYRRITAFSKSNMLRLYNLTFGGTGALVYADHFFKYKKERAQMKAVIQKEDHLGPRAGQAEVLFGRNTVWKVEAIDRARLSVVLREVDMTDAIRSNIMLKNMYNGEPLPERHMSSASSQGGAGATSIV